MNASATSSTSASRGLTITGGCLFTQSHADHVIGLQDERSLMKANVLDTALANGKKRRFTKLQASVNVRKPGQSYRHLKLRNFTLPVVKLRNVHRRSQKSWHSFASLFSGSAWLSLLIALQPPSLLKISLILYAGRLL